jgi:hypothetical protein
MFGVKSGSNNYAVKARKTKKRNVKLQHKYGHNKYNLCNGPIGPNCLRRRIS